MNFIEFAFVYFAIGAACGVHNYFRFSREVRRRLFNRLFAFASAFFWPIYLVILLAKSVNKRSINTDFDSLVDLDSAEDSKLAFRQKELELILIPSNRANKAFEFRDVVSRYTGLTSAFQSEAPDSRKNSFLDLSSSGSAIAQHVCLNRRNRQRLKRHRNEARREFVDLISGLLIQSEDIEKAGDNAIGFAKLLNDKESASAILSVLESLPQKSRAASVNTVENQTWIPQEQ